MQSAIKRSAPLERARIVVINAERPSVIAPPPGTLVKGGGGNHGAPRIYTCVLLPRLPAVTGSAGGRKAARQYVQRSMSAPEKS